MANNTHDWIRRIRSVEREYQSARLAAQRFLADAAHDPGLLTGDLKLNDVRRMAEQMEGTYLVRIFSEFETALRRFWVTVRTSNPPQAAQLIDVVASTARVTYEPRSNAHRVRDYRNALVHERDEFTAPVPLSDARQYLCTFLSFLMHRW